jgi:bifunctional UDP-N-acetylglucosamine pyrophosphorylase / glucosamine-1-phosphate N-acetyltransferase
MKQVASIILAAGKGTRMKSDLVKVLHPVLGLPMLAYPIDLSVNGLRAEETIVVIGHQAERIKERFKNGGIQFALQEEQLGTGHAVLQAMRLLRSFDGTVLILCGDVPLVKVKTVRSFIDKFQRDGCDLSVMTTVLEKPHGYGRIIRGPDGWLEKIVEEKDATPGEKQICEINTGLYCIKSSFLAKGLTEIGDDNAQREYYLTDLVEIARRKRARCSGYRVPNPVEVMGINTRVDLAVAHDAMRQEKLRALMLNGVTVVDPRNTYVDRAVEVGRDSILYPNCTLQGATRVGRRCVVESNAVISDSVIGDGVTIRGSSVITESTVESGVSVGPFAHLRPLARVKANARIGNFVEVKKSVIGKGSKANHLTYIGDSIVGDNVNIGAGTITCNYDGLEKHQTVIGDGSFVGSNVELVAPVKVGRNASIGAGTTVTKDVPPGSLAISRVKQVNVPGWDKKVNLRRQCRKGKV